MVSVTLAQHSFLGVTAITSQDEYLGNIYILLQQFNLIVLWYLEIQCEKAINLILLFILKQALSWVREDAMDMYILWFYWFLLVLLVFIGFIGFIG